MPSQKTSFGSAYGLVMRLTRISPLGRVVYGPRSRVTTDGFVSIVAAPQVTEGEPVRSTKANGKDCVVLPGRDTFDNATLTMTFCEVDPQVWHMINEQLKLTRSAFGEVNGYHENYDISGVGGGFALEVWSEAVNLDPLDPRAEGTWAYNLYPFNVASASLGEETIDVNTATFTITGKTKRGNAWGRGPYDVEVVNAVTGEIGPLLVPMTPDEWHAKLWLTVPPPQVEYGAQPVSDPDAPDVVVVEAFGDAERRTVQVLPPVVGGPWRVDWGDGSVPQDLPADGVTHQYADTVPSGLTRDYGISVWATANPDLVRYSQVSVPFDGPPAVEVPAITITEDPADPDGMSVLVAVNNHGNGTVVITWGDGTTDGTNAGDGTSTTSHAYTEEGVKTITATDATDATLTNTRQVVVPFDGGNPLTASVAEASPQGPNRRTTRLTWDNQGQGPVRITWGDNTTAVQGATTGTADHAYAAAGTYNVVVTDLSNTARSTTVPVTVPYT